MSASTDFKIVRFAPVNPDTINIEIWASEDKLAAELIWGFDGSKSVFFGGGSIETDAPAFIKLLSELSLELDQWADDLRQPGNAWDSKSDYYSGNRK